MISAACYWTDAGTTSAGDRLRNRFLRLATVNRILGPYRLSAHDDDATPGLQLASARGERVLVPDPEVLWQAADRMAGQPVDPLSPRVTGGPE